MKRFFCSSFLVFFMVLAFGWESMAISVESNSDVKDKKPGPIKIYPVSFKPITFGDDVAWVLFSFGNFAGCKYSPSSSLKEITCTQMKSFTPETTVVDIFPAHVQEDNDYHDAWVLDTNGMRICRFFPGSMAPIKCGKHKRYFLLNSP